jgi:hypothetical protein
MSGNLLVRFGQLDRFSPPGLPEIRFSLRMVPMFHQRISSCTTDDSNPDLPGNASYPNRLPWGAETGEPSVRDRSLRSLLILIGHENEQNGL